MPRLNQIEIAANKMGELVRSNLVKTLQRANEAKTRLLIIDEVLDILGWSKSEYEPELATAVGGYTDYRLTIEGQARLIVEAKRVGIISPLSRAIQSPEYTNSFLYNNYGPEMKSLLDQCLNYCSHTGVPYALATTGEVWIIMAGFKYGIEWGKLKSFVFHSLDDVLSRFGSFYGLISRDAIKNNSLEEKFGGMLIIKPSIAIRPREHVNQTSEVGQAPNRQVIRAFFDEFMGDITRPGQEKLLQQCYVDNHELNEFSRDLQQILQYDAVIDELEFPIEEADEPVLEKELELQSASSNPKTILLVGNVGAGKSTFVHRFVRYEARPDQNVCTIIDLINHATTNIVHDRAEEQRLAEMVLDRLAKEFQEKIDPYSLVVLRGCFEIEIGRFKKQRQALLKLDQTTYELREEEYIYELSRDKYKHLVGYIKYARKKRFKFWIVFDNVDRGSDTYQHFIYSFAHQLAADANCVTLITLRQDTFLEAQEAGFLDVRSSDIVFQINAPEFRQVISKRRKYIDRMIDRGEIPRQFKTHVSLMRLLNWHLNHLVLDQNDFIRLFITTFSLNNLRYGLAMLRDYYTSYHSTFHEFYRNYENETNYDNLPSFNYKLEHNRFIQALMLGNSWDYQEEKSDIFNIYSVEPLEKISHFLMLRILAYLGLKHSNTSSKHSIRYEKVSNDFISLGYQRHHINNAIVKLLYAGLAVSPNLPAIPIMDAKIEVPDPLPQEIKIALSGKGYYYLEKMASLQYYQTRVGEDTVWYNEELANSYIKCLQDSLNAQQAGSDDVLQATDAREIFLNYLRKSLLEETESSNIRFTTRDWAQAMNNIVENKVFGEAITQSFYVNEEDEKKLTLSNEHRKILSELFLRSVPKPRRKPQHEQLFLFTEGHRNEEAIRTVMASLGSRPKDLQLSTFSKTATQILWSLEIAFRVGLGSLTPKRIAEIINIYGEEFVTTADIAQFLEEQKRQADEYAHLWREEPRGRYTINSFGQNMLNSLLGNDNHS